MVRDDTLRAHGFSLWSSRWPRQRRPLRIPKSQVVHAVSARKRGAAPKARASHSAGERAIHCISLSTFRPAHHTHPSKHARSYPRRAGRGSLALDEGHEAEPAEERVLELREVVLRSPRSASRAYMQEGGDAP
jgi:hypothetical protein